MKPRLIDTPIAFAINGTILINVAELVDVGNVSNVIDAAAAVNATVFVGVPLDARDAKLVLTRLDNAAAEAVAQIVGRQRRRRATARRRRSIDS
jgi:ABC-type molybdate transport system permease subunit